MKKIKIGLPNFELLKVTEIRDTFLNNLKDNNSQGHRTQSAATHTQASPTAGRPHPNSVHVIQDVPCGDTTNSSQGISYGNLEDSTQRVA